MLRKFIGCAICLLLVLTITAQENRSYSGYGNNFANNTWGAANAEMPRVSTTNYADGISQINDTNLPEPRVISNKLFDQQEFIYDANSLSDFIWVFGQFVDHDISLVESNPAEAMALNIPDDDRHFSPQSKIFTSRNLGSEDSGTSTDNPRQYINTISAFIDGSAVYGSDDQRADWLRTFEGGKLKVSEGNLLPWNTTTGEFNSSLDLINSPDMADDTGLNTKLFVAGDIRANENPLLITMHTLFVREHNRLCEEYALEHPGWSDEILYQRARKMIGAYIQKITFEDWLPAMGVYLPEYPGYNQEMNPGIFNVFSAAAFRIGHTMINSDLIRMSNSGGEITQGNVRLKDAFFNPLSIVLAGGIDPYFKGMGTQIMQEMDCKIVDDLRNFLFGSPGAGGLDLAAINIFRGRDRGISDYNTLRRDFGLPEVSDFEDFTANPDDVEVLQGLYGDYNKLDAWVGILSEKHLNGAILGELSMKIIERQFQLLRDGDRFYYENDPVFNENDLAQIQNTALHDIIMRNTSISLMQKNVFEAMPHSAIPNGPDLAELQLESVLYPNPTFDQTVIKIYSDIDRDITIKIFNTNGQLIEIRNETLIPGDNFLPFKLNSFWPRGLYNLLIESDDHYSILKLVKE